MDFSTLQNLGIWILLLVILAIPSMVVAASEETKQHPVYISFFIHCESSPIRGVPVDVQYEPYSGEGILPRNQYLDKILDVCEKYNIKFEFAVTPLFAQQLREDRPDIIERIKRMKLPISRYPAIAGHMLPAPVGEMRDMPGMALSQLRNREISWDDYIVNEWIAETRTLVPTWRFEGNRVVIDNPRKGTPIQLKELSEYRIPEDERRLYGGTLALEEIFGVIPLATFPEIFRNDKSRFVATPVRKALGMGSFEASRHPLDSFNAPIRASNPRMADWFVEHFPVDKPLHADSGFGYTHNYQGQHLGLDVKEELIQYAIENPDKYQIVWADPEETQWKPENSPLAFFEKTYGVTSLEEIRNMPPPIEKVKGIDSSIPIRMATIKELDRVEEKYLYTLSELGVTSDDGLPDFLRPKTHWVREDQVNDAARWIVDHTSFSNDVGSLPGQVEAGGENWSLATAFVALVNSFENFGLRDRLPTNLSFPEVVGPVDHPLARVETIEAVDDQVGRQGEVPEDAFINEVNLLQAAWETAARIRSDQKIPDRIQVQISQGRSGNYTGRPIQVNPAEFLYAMASEILVMEKDGLPDEVRFRRVLMAPDDAAQSDGLAAPMLNAIWTGNVEGSSKARTSSRSEILQTAEYLMASWAGGHLGHSEDIGGPPMGIPLDGDRIGSLNDAYQGLAYSLSEYSKTGKVPEQVALSDVVGPIDYPMYDLRAEPAYDIRGIRGGWKPYEMDSRDFPPEEWITPQGLPGYGHGSYQAFIKSESVLASVNEAVSRLRETGMIPGSVQIELPDGPRSPRKESDETYINAAELLWGMAQLYRYIEVLGKPDDVLIRSCRLIQNQLHFTVVGLSPLGFSRQTYRFRRDQFDWIEKIPVWRIQKTWSYSSSPRSSGELSQSD